MIFKLIIVMVALFAIPAAEFADLPFACSAAALFFNLLWVGASQPFEDGWETVQEISSTLTNLVNTVVALMLGQDGLGDTGATVMLFVYPFGVPLLRLSETYRRRAHRARRPLPKRLLVRYCCCWCW